MVIAKAQDLPPSGGYSPLQTERIKLRNIIGWRANAIYFVVSNIIGFTAYAYKWRQVKREETEMLGAKFAVLPIIMAERDRAMLKRIRMNRDEEADLMKDVEGWEVGTLFGAPIYYTRPEDEWVMPIEQEIYGHCNPREVNFLTQRYKILA